jgi:hypothetical protein
VNAVSDIKRQALKLATIRDAIVQARAALNTALKEVPESENPVRAGIINGKIELLTRAIALIDDD